MRFFIYLFILSNWIFSLSLVMTHYEFKKVKTMIVSYQSWKQSWLHFIDKKWFDKPRYFPWINDSCSTYDSAWYTPNISRKMPNETNQLSQIFLSYCVGLSLLISFSSAENRYYCSFGIAWRKKNSQIIQTNRFI